MSMDLESRLRAALRPLTPDETFTQKLLARLTVDRAKAKPRRFAWRGSKPLAWWLSAGLAASLLLAVGIQQHREEQARQRGLEARREVVEALRMTSQKLNLAYEAVQSASSLADEQPGA